MLRILSLATIIFLVLAPVAPAADQPPDPPPFAAQALSIASTLQGAIASAEKLDGKWEFALAGEAFPAGHAAVQPENVEFEIGSISKVFTGLLLADAVVEGKLKLSDSLAERLPVKFADPATGGITLQQLASHSSCLPRLPDNLTTQADADPYATYDDRRLFAYLASAKLGGHPPCEASYSNLAYGILGVVLERTYREPWAKLVHEKITGPLGMTDTVQELSLEQRGRLAAPWNDRKPGHEWTFKAIAGAGALHSTIGDLSKFADAILAGGDGPLGKAWRLLAGDYSTMAFIGGKIGLGLEHITFDHQDGWGDSYTHEGATGAYRGLFEVWPTKKRALVILTDNSAATPIAWVAVWKTLGAMQAERVEIKLPSATLDEYVGVYPITKEAGFTVLRRGDQLVARLTGQPFFPIFASARDEFFYRVVIADLHFRRNPTGKVDHLTLVQSGRAIDADKSSAPPPHLEFPGREELGQFIGDYDFGGSQPGAQISVKVVDDTLYAMLAGQQWLPVFATGKDRFDYDVVTAALTFERDTTGKVVAVILHQNGSEQRAPRR